MGTGMITMVDWTSTWTPGGIVAIAFFGTVALVLLGILLWLRTEKGGKWLENRSEERRVGKEC
jgi:hypothetical protein